MGFKVCCLVLTVAANSRQGEKIKNFYFPWGVGLMEAGWKAISKVKRFF
jgi:hypothetical protein